MTTIPTYLLWVIGGILPFIALLIGLVTVLVNRTGDQPRGAGPDDLPVRWGHGAADRRGGPR